MLVDEVDGSVSDREGGDLTAVLDELDLDALPDGGVGLLSLDSDLLQDDAARLGGSLERIGFLPQLENPLLVAPVQPAELLAVRFHFPCGVQTVSQFFTSFII